MHVLMMQHDMLESLDAVLGKGDEAKFRLYEVRIFKGTAQCES